VGRHTLTGPSHLLPRINARLRCTEFEPHRAASIPTLHVSTRWHFGKIVLRRARMIDLLRRHIVDHCTGRNGHNIRGVGRAVATDIRRRWVLNPLLRVGILSLAGCRPVLLFGFAIYH
jgi:hypothetical protein